MTSSRPYLIRALYEWLNDNKYTPYIMVDTTLPDVFVPEEYVNNGKIVLNIAPEAVFDLLITNINLEFHASFSGRSRYISMPISAVMAIYAQENNTYGMVFGHEPGGDTPPDNSKYGVKKEPSKDANKKSHLKIVK